MRRLKVVVTLFSALVSFGVGSADAQMEDFIPVTDAMLERPADEDWLTWRRTTNGWGYSPLDEINVGNVGDIRMVWTRAMMPGRMEGTPLAYGGVMYMPQSDDAIDALNAVTGDRSARRRVRVGGW